MRVVVDILQNHERGREGLDFVVAGHLLPHLANVGHAQLTASHRPLEVCALALVDILVLVPKIASFIDIVAPIFVGIGFLPFADNRGSLGLVVLLLLFFTSGEEQRGCRYQQQTKD